MMRPFIRFSNPFKPSGKASPRFISLWAVLSLMKMHTSSRGAAQSGSGDGGTHGMPADHVEKMKKPYLCVAKLAKYAIMNRHDEAKLCRLGEGWVDGICDTSA